MCSKTKNKTVPGLMKTCRILQAYPTVTNIREQKSPFFAVLFYFYCGCVGSITVIALRIMGGDKHEANVLLCTRVRRMLDVQKNVDDDRIEMLERMIREASDTVMESERKYEEVQLFRSLFCFVFLVDCYHLSVCLLCNAVTFENLDPESSFSVCTYTFRIFILIPFIKVVRLRYCFLVLHISWYQAGWRVITGMVAGGLPSTEKQSCYFMCAGMLCNFFVYVCLW